MKIAIDNLGPIKHADIDLNKDLIILCGGNNSGKTYVAYSVYGLFKGSRMQGDVEMETSRLLIDLLKYGNISLDLGAFFLLKKEIMIKQLEERFVWYLPTIFASEEDFFKSTSINIILDDESVIQKLKESSGVKGFSFGEYINIQFKKEKHDLLNISITKDNKEEKEFEDESILYVIEMELIEVIYELIFVNIHIETAERTAINLFSKELSEKRNELVNMILDIQKKHKLTDLVQSQSSRYSLPIRDSLYLANRIDLLQKNKSPYAYLADEIEKVILQGKIKVGKNGEMQFNPNKSKANLGIHLTASGVKSLASIIFYLRHTAKKGDFFIIDEPELNLHPDNQRKVARVIAQMVNAGIKVMLSTHSDYIIRELNNLIMLDVKGNDKVVNKLIKKYGYKQEQILNPEKVGVYLFTDKVEALEVNATGFEVKSIDDEINALNESAQDIFFTLHDN